MGANSNVKIARTAHQIAIHAHVLNVQKKDVIAHVVQMKMVRAAQKFVTDARTARLVAIHVFAQNAVKKDAAAHVAPKTAM